MILLRIRQKKVSLTNTEIIVSGGRGVGNAEGFTLLEELAEVLGGVVGASRYPWIVDGLAIQDRLVKQDKQFAQIIYSLWNFRCYSAYDRHVRV